MRPLWRADAIDNSRAHDYRAHDSPTRAAQVADQTVTMRPTKDLIIIQLYINNITVSNQTLR
jgi:hypothetical protein